MQIPWATLLPSRKRRHVVFLLLFRTDIIATNQIKNASLETFLPIPVHVVVKTRQMEIISNSYRFRAIWRRPNPRPKLVRDELAPPPPGGQAVRFIDNGRGAMFL